MLVGSWQIKIEDFNNEVSDTLDYCTSYKQNKLPEEKKDSLDSKKGKISTETSVGAAFSTECVYFNWNTAFIAKDQRSLCSNTSLKTYQKIILHAFSGRIQIRYSYIQV